MRLLSDCCERFRQNNSSVEQNLARLPGPLVWSQNKLSSKVTVAPNLSKVLTQDQYLQNETKRKQV